jgi:hypothetical protein
MSLANLFKLEKMRIEGYLDERRRRQRARPERENHPRQARRAHAHFAHSGGEKESTDPAEGVLLRVRIPIGLHGG